MGEIKRNNYSYKADRPCLVCANNQTQGPKCLTCFYFAVHSTANCKDIFSTPFKKWSPAEVKRIRIALGKSRSEFAEMFIVATATVEAWESKEGTDRHREVYGSDARLMWAAAELAQGKMVNLVRLAASGEL